MKELKYYQWKEKIKLISIIRINNNLTSDCGVNPTYTLMLRLAKNRKTGSDWNNDRNQSPLTTFDFFDNIIFDRNKKRMKKYFPGPIILSAIFCLSSCASEYAYDSENPEAYKKHWVNNEEIKNNEFLYQISEECKENKGKNCIDL